MVRAYRSEWLKLRRPGMLLGGLGAMIGFAILGTVLAVLRADSGRGELTIARLSHPDGFAAMMQRTSDFLGIVALGIVAITVAQEYSHGTLRNLLVLEPRRLRLLSGKLLATLTFVGAGVVLATAVALAVGLAIAPSKGIDTSGWLGSGLRDTLGTTVDLTLAALAYGVFGGLLGLLLRSPAPAVIAGVAWLLPVENALTAAWTSVGHWLPGQQLGAVVEHGNSVSTYGFALALGAAFVAAAAVAGGAMFQLRDVSA
jgi:ABC-type transport system involved in multi-copper enzyme maturation permease subunit